jgi:putative component of toxin-antitoxin plasmid stabilization module
MRWWYALPVLVVLPSVGLAQSDNEKMAAEVEAACQAQKDGETWSGFFSSRADMARVLLCAGYKYRLTTDAGGLRIELSSVQAGVQRPQVKEIMGGGGGAAGMGIIMDLMASASGVFELRPAMIRQGAGVKVRLERTGTWEHDKDKDKDKKD